MCISYLVLILVFILLVNKSATKEEEEKTNEPFESIKCECKTQVKTCIDCDKMREIYFNFQMF